MTVLEFIQTYWDEGLLYLFLASGIIQFTPIKLNPWSWFAAKIGNAINKDLLKEVKALDTKVDDVQKVLEQHMLNNEIDNAKMIRQRVLRFNDEILQGVRHTQEHYIETLHDIDDYEKFCIEHEDFPNNQATLAIQNIKDTYKLCLVNKDFL